jgi:2-amino-4-hydroxy-6-hydroxymethyldihydropteridine diphosphokinase
VKVGGLHRVWIGLGSNQGERKQNICQAIEHLKDAFVYEGWVESPLYESRPVGFVSENLFLNSVVTGLTSLKPDDMLTEILRIEKTLGRLPRMGEEYEDRLIDLDILLYGDFRIWDKDLKIPHPHMIKRSFVLLPMKWIINRNAQLKDSLPKEVREGVENCSESVDVYRITDEPCI